MSLEQAEEARLDLRTGGEDGGTLHQVLELAQVPGPGILLEQLAGPRREGGAGLGSRTRGRPEGSRPPASRLV